MRTAREDFSNGGDDAATTAAADWLVARDRGLTPAEEAEFERWLLEPRHARAWAEAQQAWSSLDRLAEFRPSSQPPVAARWRRRAITLAGAAAVLAVGFFVFAHRPPSRESDAAPQIVRAAPRTVMLPDGSRVELNGDAVVTERFTAAERRVQLQRGEAHFTVTKNKARPFIVEADGLVVRAVGTAFNVRLDPAAVEVLVTEGQVRVAKDQPTAIGHGAPQESASTDPAARPEAPLLAAGQRAIARRDPASSDIAISSVAAQEMAQLLAWQSLQLKFHDLPLDQVAAEFNRHNRTRLIVDPGAADTLVAGNFGAENVDLFVRFLEEAFQIAAERRDDGTIVLRKAAANR